jgi:hypothetical protein
MRRNSLTTDCVIRTMITDAQAGRPTRVAFGRDFPRPYIHVADAPGALVMTSGGPVWGPGVPATMQSSQGGRKSPPPMRSNRP